MEMIQMLNMKMSIMFCVLFDILVLFKLIIQLLYLFILSYHFLPIFSLLYSLFLVQLDDDQSHKQIKNHIRKHIKPERQNQRAQREQSPKNRFVASFQQRE